MKEKVQKLVRELLNNTKELTEFRLKQFKKKLKNCTAISNVVELTRFRLKQFRKKLVKQKQIDSKQELLKQTNENVIICEKTNVKEKSDTKLTGIKLRISSLINNIKQVTKKQVTALSTIAIMLVQMFSPYSVLLNTVSAAIDKNTDTLVLVTASPVEESTSGNKIIKVTYAAVAENVVGTDFSIGYDSTKIKPAKRKTGAECTLAKLTNNATTSCLEYKGALSDGIMTAQTADLDTTASNIRIQLTSSATVDLSENGYSSADVEDSHGYDYYMELFTLYFYLVDNSITQLTTDMLYWDPVAGSNPYGFKYQFDSGTSITPDISVAYENFAEANAKIVTSIEVKTNPTDLTYENGEKLDFTGGTIRINYDDSTYEDVDIKTGLADGTFTVDSEYASSTTKKAVFTCSDKTVEIPYYTLSNVVLGTGFTTTYDHGASIDYTGGELELVFTDSEGNPPTTQDEGPVDIKAGITDGSIITDTTKASVKKNSIDLTYKGYTVNIPITVNDPIDHIEITSPNKKEYKDGDTISFEGGTVKIITKSIADGTTSETNAQVVQYNDSRISISPTLADITKISEANLYTTSDTSLKAGTQTVTVTYTDSDDGKAYTGTYTVLVNDVVTSVTLTDGATNTLNKYGTTKDNLNFSNLKAKVITRGGGDFTVDASSLTIDLTSYVNNTLGLQELPVSYAGVSASDRIQLYLQDYIVDITPSFNKTTFEYNTSKDDIASAGTYVKNYASGATSTSINLTADMITGYNPTPTQTMYDTNRECKETLNITLSTGDGSFDEVPIIKTQEIIVKDSVVSIAIDKKPQTSFDYGDTFVYTNGTIKALYASGVSDTIYMSDSSVKLTQEDGITNVTTEPASSKFTNGQAKETVLVTYTKDTKTYTTTYDITINDSITGIAIKDEPTKQFNHNDTFSTGSGTLTVTYAVAGDQTVPMSDNNVYITQTDDTAVNMTPSTYDANHQYTEHLKVDYMGENAYYDIVITNAITKIEIVESPKTTYNYNESTTNNIGGKIKITRQNGETETIDVTDSMVSNLFTTSRGTRKATISYTENGVTKTVDYEYTVANSVTGIVINIPSKTNYNHGDALEKGTIKLTYSNGATGAGNWDEVVITEEDGEGNDVPYSMTPTEDEYNAATPKNKVSKTLKITLTKDGITQSVNYPITITNNVKSIRMGTTPKTEYNVNDSLNIENGTIWVKRALGAEEEVSIIEGMVSGFKNDKEYTDLPITVSYTENDITQTTSYNVNVKDDIQDLIITNAPTTVKYGKDIDWSNTTIEVQRGSGNVKLTIDDVTITDDATTTVGPITVKVSYGGIEKEIPVTVEDYMTGIVLNPPTKDKYEYGEVTELDLTGGYVQKVMASGAEVAQIPLSDTTQVTLSAFNPKLAITQTIYVTYEGETKSFAVIVEDNVQSIEMGAYPKQSYTYGEALNIENGTILVTRTSTAETNKKETISLADCEVTEYNPTVLGD